MATAALDAAFPFGRSVAQVAAMAQALRELSASVNELKASQLKPSAAAAAAAHLDESSGRHRHRSRSRSRRRAEDGETRLD